MRVFLVILPALQIRKEKKKREPEKIVGKFCELKKRKRGGHNEVGPHGDKYASLCELERSRDGKFREECKNVRDERETSNEVVPERTVQPLCTKIKLEQATERANYAGSEGRQQDFDEKKNEKNARANKKKKKKKATREDAVCIQVEEGKEERRKITVRFVIQCP
jgi:hypothetical protein